MSNLQAQWNVSADKIFKCKTTTRNSKIWSLDNSKYYVTMSHFSFFYFETLFFYNVLNWNDLGTVSLNFTQQKSELFSLYPFSDLKLQFSWNDSDFFRLFFDFLRFVPFCIGDLNETLPKVSVKEGWISISDLLVIWTVLNYFSRGYS